jgi:uncharacterized membrane protein
MTQCAEEGKTIDDSYMIAKMMQYSGIGLEDMETMIYNPDFDSKN